MKLICAPQSYQFPSSADHVGVVLYGREFDHTQGHAGAAIAERFKRAKWSAPPLAWDFLSIALAVISADLAGHRKISPDGWTRELEIVVAVVDPDFWSSQIEALQRALRFLTTDIWTIRFVEGGFLPKAGKPVKHFDGDSACLLSGGMDSLIGTLHRVSKGSRPVTVSQTVSGDGDKQRNFPRLMAGGLSRVILNHNASVPNSESPPSQRSRSISFIAYGVMVAASIATQTKEKTSLFMCENGFISLNPPLTPMRVGSLSTRTTHPGFLNPLREVLDAAGLNVEILNPHQFQTKGEMLINCPDQGFLKKHAFYTTSCGRYKQHKSTHCGRCVPCLIRRSAIHAWGKVDKTQYVYEDIGKDDPHYAGFDDVRAAATAVIAVKKRGIERWLGASLSEVPLVDRDDYCEVAERGINELGKFLKARKVK
ncbi:MULTISPECIES: Qat anti-phage system QueC-like protein QatC [Hyphomonas]|jgi:hypothetical protein|uniref:Qat anti-phage system QueC-like protein QatC n=1 Tax=Hyphomonas TaxID=85 RepID=UPI003516E6C0